jgi:excisionase family DNA binding protein
MKRKLTPPTPPHLLFAYLETDVKKLLRVSWATVSYLVEVGRLSPFETKTQDGQETYSGIRTSSLFKSFPSLFADGGDPFTTLEGRDKRLRLALDDPRVLLDTDLLTVGEVGEVVGEPLDAIYDRIDDKSLRSVTIKTDGGWIYRVTAGEVRKRFPAAFLLPRVPQTVPDKSRKPVADEHEEAAARKAAEPEPPGSRHFDLGHELKTIVKAATKILGRASPETMRRFIVELRANRQRKTAPTRSEVESADPVCRILPERSSPISGSDEPEMDGPILPNRPLLTPSEVAKTFAVSLNTIYAMIKNGQIQSIQIGDVLRPRYRIVRSSLVGRYPILFVNEPKTEAVDPK